MNSSGVLIFGFPSFLRSEMTFSCQVHVKFGLFKYLLRRKEID